MIVKELTEKLSSCNDEATLMIIQEEELECMPEYWADEERKVIGNATKLYSEDLHSHEFCLLAIEN